MSARKQLKQSWRAFPNPVVHAIDGRDRWLLTGCYDEVVLVLDGEDCQIRWPMKLKRHDVVVGQCRESLAHEIPRARWRDSATAVRDTCQESASGKRPWTIVW